MTDDNSLYSDPKQPDEFRTESPLRAFAEYTEFGGWLIAKGFRPSMQHLVRYLAAMESREGYRLVQILEAATGVPTMIFRTTARAPLDVVSDVFKSSELARDWKGHLVGHIDPEKERHAQEIFDRNFGKSTATFSGPADKPDYAPEIADYETDDEGKPWKLHVVFKGERATFFADFLRGDRRGEINHSSHYVVEWFDNVTQTVHRQPVAEWPEWARELLSAKPLAEESEDAEAVGTVVDWTPPESAIYGVWADGRFFITFPHGVGGETARLASPPGYTFYGFKGDSLQKTAFYTEVTSESPVDTSYDIPDDQKVEAIHYVVDRVVNPKWRSKALRDFKKSFMNPKGTPLPPHDKFDAQLAFTLSTDIGNVRNHLAAFKRTKQGDKAIHEMVERNAPAIRELLGAKYKSDRQHDFGDVACRICGDTGKIMSIGISDICPGEDCLARSVDVTMTNHPDGRMEITFDDANPEHYNGWECGDIGERLSANGYQILKYCWRLGKKDDPCKELGKAIRYCEREIDLMITLGAKSHNPDMRITPSLAGIARGGSSEYIKADQEFFLHNRIAKEPEFTKTIAIKLWAGYNLAQLEAIKADIADHKVRLDCGHGLAI